MKRALISLIVLIVVVKAWAIAPLYISITGGRTDNGEFIQLSGSTSESAAPPYYYFKDLFAGRDYVSYNNITSDVRLSARAASDGQIFIQYKGAGGISGDVIDIQGLEPPLYIGKLYSLTNAVMTWSTNTMWTRVGNATRYTIVAREIDNSKSYDIPCGAGKNLLFRGCVISVNSDVPTGSQLYLRHTETGRVYTGTEWHLGSLTISNPPLFGRFTVHETAPGASEDTPLYGNLQTDNRLILHGADGSVLYGDIAKWFATNFNVWTEWVFNEDYNGYLQAYINGENVCPTHTTGHIIENDVKIGSADFVVQNGLIECYFTMSLKISEGAPCTSTDSCTYRVWLNAETYDLALVGEKAAYSGNMASVVKFKLTYNGWNKTWTLEVSD